jgi:YVTN family beta-propeller protein
MKKIVLLSFIFTLSLPSVLYCQYLETIIPVGSYPRALVYNSTNQKVYCANMGSNTATVINATNNQVITTIRVGSEPCALAYNNINNKIYCANQQSNDVSIINGATNEVLNTISVGSRPSALAYNSVSNKIYCANASSNNVSVIDGVVDNLITNVVVGYFPSTLVYNPTNNRIYCANMDNECVTIIDGVTNQVIATVQVGVHPVSLAYNPENNEVYCASWANGRIHMINGATNQKVDSIIYGNSGPQSLIYLSYNRIGYVNFVGDNIKLIDGTSDTIIATYQFPVGTRPYALSTTNYYLYCANIGSYNVHAFSSYSLYMYGTVNNINYPITLISITYPRTYVANLWSSTVSVIIGPVGVEENSISNIENLKMHIYPNPAKSFFTIHLPQSAKHSTLKIFDVSGKLARVEELNSLGVQEFGVSTKGISPGLYFVQLNNVSEVGRKSSPVTEKLVITQ